MRAIYGQSLKKWGPSGPGRCCRRLKDARPDDEAVEPPTDTVE